MLGLINLEGSLAAYSTQQQSGLDGFVRNPNKRLFFIAKYYAVAAVKHGRTPQSMIELGAFRLVKKQYRHKETD